MEQRVLVIDDDPPTRTMIAAVLAREQFSVDVCADAATAAVLLFDADHPVIVIAMVQRDPAGDADFLLHLKRRQPPPCVVLISAGSQAGLDAMLSDLVRARLRKPFQIEELITAVRSCFETS